MVFHIESVCSQVTSLDPSHAWWVGGHSSDKVAEVYDKDCVQILSWHQGDRQRLTQHKDLQMQKEHNKIH